MDVHQAYSAYFSQQHRLLDLRFGRSGPPASLLVPQRAVLTEALSEPYTLNLVGVSLDRAIDQKTLLWQIAAVGINDPVGGRRVITGIVTQLRYLGEDGGLSHYGLRIQPALSLLALRSNSRTFQDLNAPDIAATLFDEHIARDSTLALAFRFRHQLRHEPPIRSLFTQYNESDLAVTHRLLAVHGISYRFSFDDSDETPTHTLELFDDAMDLPAAAQPTLRYRRSDRGIDTSLSHWDFVDDIVSSATTLSTYDYKSVQQKQATSLSLLNQGRPLEDYTAQPPYYGSNLAQLDRYALLRQQAHDLKAQTYHGEASRAMAVGEWFTLEDHPAHEHDTEERRQFVVIGQQLEVVNNLPVELARTLDPSALPDGARITSHFKAVRRGVPLVPAYAGTLQRPTAPGPQSAIVVGPPKTEVYTDPLGRIRIQRHWQRPEDHPNGGAAFDERSSTWVRVLTPHAGDGFGQSFIPRVGEEVIVEYLDGDIDRPVVIGGVHNGHHAPPFRLPDDVTLSGLRSREHGGTGSNALVLDDTPGAIGTRLSSTHRDTSLGLGHLIERWEDGTVHPWGTGVAMRTAAAQGFHAGEGVLIAAHPPGFQPAHQLDGGAMLDLLSACLEQLKAQGAYAEQHGRPATDLAHPTQLLDALNNGPAKDRPTATSAPVLALTAAAGIVNSTPQTHITFAGQDIDTVAQQNLQLTSGQRFIVRAGWNIDLFAQGAFSAVARQGDLLLQALDGDLIANAVKKVLLTAQDALELCAKRITLRTPQGTYLTLDEHITLGTTGDVRVHGAHHQFQGPASLPAALPVLPRFDLRPNWLDLTLRGHASEPMRHVTYTLAFADGSQRTGKLDEHGFAHEPAVPWGATSVVYENADEAKDATYLPVEDVTDASQPTTSVTAIIEGHA